MRLRATLDQAQLGDAAVDRFTVREAMSENFDARVDLTTPSADVDLAALLDTASVLTLSDEESGTDAFLLHGMIDEEEVGQGRVPPPGHSRRGRGARAGAGRFPLPAAPPPAALRPRLPGAQPGLPGEDGGCDRGGGPEGRRLSGQRCFLPAFAKLPEARAVRAVPRERAEFRPATAR